MNLKEESSSDSEDSKNEDDSYESDSVKEEEKDEDDKEDMNDEDDEILNEDEEIRKEEEKRNEEEDMDDKEEEDSEEEEDDDDDFQKLSSSMTFVDLEKLHPDTHVCNNEEVMALSKVVRNAKGMICDPMHTTLPFITKYEKARMIGARAEQIDRGALPLVPVEPDIINGRIIAQMEFEQKKIPFIIARPLPNGTIEYWRMSDLEILL